MKPCSMGLPIHPRVVLVAKSWHQFSLLSSPRRFLPFQHLRCLKFEEAGIDEMSSTIIMSKLSPRLGSRQNCFDVMRLDHF